MPDVFASAYRIPPTTASTPTQMAAVFMRRATRERVPCFGLGVGFAMPSNIVAKVYNDLISPDHKVVRGSIGISFQGAQSSAVSRMYGFANGGVLVNTVTPDGPAAKGGVKPGDVIVSIGTSGTVFV